MNFIWKIEEHGFNGVGLPTATCPYCGTYIIIQLRFDDEIHQNLMLYPK